MKKLLEIASNSGSLGRGKPIRPVSPLGWQGKKPSATSTCRSGESLKYTNTKEYL